MKTILVFMSLLLSTTAVGQTGEKYIIKDDSINCWVMPKDYYSIVQKFTRGKTLGGMRVGNKDYWNATIPLLEKKYFTEQQMTLFKEKGYRFTVFLTFDYTGNMKCLRMLVSKQVIDIISQKQLRDLYQALWKIKPPMGPEWSDEHYGKGTIRLIPLKVRE